MVFKPVVTTSALDPSGLPRGQRGSRLYGRDRLDAHLFAREDVDRRLRRWASRSPISTPSSIATCRGATIDMDFMNLTRRRMATASSASSTRPAQAARSWSATGRIPRCRTGSRPGCARPRAWHDLQGAKFARFGDNMRQVAVTEGDKVSAEMQFGLPSMATASATWSGDLRGGTTTRRRAVAEYEDRYTVARCSAPEAHGTSAPLRCAHRARPARLSRGGRLQGVHRHVRGSPRPPPASRAWRCSV